MRYMPTSEEIHRICRYARAVEQYEKEHGSGYPYSWHVWNWMLYKHSRGC